MAGSAEDKLTQGLRELALERMEVDLVGVAPAERLQGGPAGGRPTDYLPAARSVVVLAAKIPDAVIEVAGRYDEPGKTLGPYMWYGYPVMNWDLSSVAGRVAKFLERHGYKGLPFPPTGLLYKFGNRADFSHRHAAVAAGLGEFGWSGLLLTPQFGPQTEAGLHRHRRPSGAVPHVRRAQAVPPRFLRASVRRSLPHGGDDRAGCRSRSAARRSSTPGCIRSSASGRLRRRASEGPRWPCRKTRRRRTSGRC